MFKQDAGQLESSSCDQFCLLQGQVNRQWNSFIY